MESKNIVIMFVVIALVAVGFVVAFLPRVDQYLKIQAVKVCNEGSKFSIKIENGADVTGPSVEAYDKCLKDTGIVK